MFIERAAGGPLLHDRSSTLEMACKFRGRPARLRGVGSIWQLSKGTRCCRARGWGDRRSTLEMACKFRGITLTHSLTRSLAHSPTYSLTQSPRSLTLTHTDALVMTHLGVSLRGSGSIDQCSY